MGLGITHDIPQSFLDVNWDCDISSVAATTIHTLLPLTLGLGNIHGFLFLIRSTALLLPVAHRKTRYHFTLTIWLGTAHDKRPNARYGVGQSFLLGRSRQKPDITSRSPFGWGLPTISDQALVTAWSSRFCLVAADKNPDITSRSPG